MGKWERCPFCKSYNLIVAGAGGENLWEIICEDCGATGPTKSTPVLAISGWNNAPRK